MTIAENGKKGEKLAEPSAGKVLVKMVLVVMQCLPVALVALTWEGSLAEAKGRQQLLMIAHETTSHLWHYGEVGVQGERRASSSTIHIAQDWARRYGLCRQSLSSRTRQWMSKGVLFIVTVLC